MSALEVRVSQPESVTDALVVIGVPTIGHVGAIAGQYIVEALDMRPIGGVMGPTLPPVALIEAGRPSPPVRIHTIETVCGLGLRCEHLVTVTANVLPRGPPLHEVARTLAEWCHTIGADMVAIPDGMIVEGGQEGEAVRGVVTSAAGLGALDAGGVTLLDHGVLAGFSALFLLEAERVGLDAIALLADSDPTLPDARAAARLVEVLDRFVPAIHIETGPLLAQAALIEEHVRALGDELARQQQAQGARRDPMVG